MVGWAWETPPESCSRAAEDAADSGCRVGGDEVAAVAVI